MLLVITAALAMVLSVALALMINANVVGISFIPFWLALYYGWPYLSRRLPFLDFDKAPTTPVPRRPLWLRLIRGTLAWVGGIGLALACMSSTAIVPIVLCERRAQKVHDSIHIGMTVQRCSIQPRIATSSRQGRNFPTTRRPMVTTSPPWD